MSNEKRLTIKRLAILYAGEKEKYYTKIQSITGDF